LKRFGNSETAIENFYEGIFLATAHVELEQMRNKMKNHIARIGGIGAMEEPSKRTGSIVIPLLAAVLSVTLGPTSSEAQGGILNGLYSFTGGSDGGRPLAALVQGSDGYFYGTTFEGGSTGLNERGRQGYGTVFKIGTDGALTSLYSFTNGIDGEYPWGLVQGSDGYFYGTGGGGTNGLGSVFKISPNGTFTNLYSFTGGSDGGQPEAALVQGSDGNLYGTTSGGGLYDSAGTPGPGPGTIFKISTNGTFTSLYSFTGGSDGGTPMAALVQGRDGNFYGTTFCGGLISGIDGCGTIFRFSTNGTLTTLYSFTGGSDGGNPWAALVQGSDGNFYGTTSAYDYDSAHGNGSVFEISTNGTFTSLHIFNGRTDRELPIAALVQGSDDNFYGTTSSGGATNLNDGYGYGTLFEISTNGTFTRLYSFTGSTDGAVPSGLVQGRDGYFYGTTQGGGLSGNGTVFKLLIRPTITFTANPTSGVAPLSVNFTTPSTDPAGNSITQWNWNFGDGSTSTNQNPTHTYTTAGTFNPTLFATNAAGVTLPGAGPASITVTPNTQPGISSVSLSGTDLVLSATNGISGNMYLVLTSANLALPLSQWTPIATNILSANGNFTMVLPNTVNGNVPQLFYVLESQ
jgi:uncharacterized repeat protein (TIGR03803 family)